MVTFRDPITRVLSLPLLKEKEPGNEGPHSQLNFFSLLDSLVLGTRLETGKSISEVHDEVN